MAVPPNDRDIFGSLTMLSIEALKFSGLINAGAAVVVLANLKDLSMVVTAAALLWSIAAFGAGAVLCAIAHACAYLTNLRLLQEETHQAKDGGHERFLYAAIGCFFASVLAFAAGVVIPLRALVYAL